MYRMVLPLLLTVALTFGGCTAGQDMPGKKNLYMDTTENVIYLAGGCFWGMEQLMQSFPGVIDAQSGYANGTCKEDADYKTVCNGNTGFRETVRVEYNPETVKPRRFANDILLCH